ncbi:hypothetical protein CIB84_014911, partial [Bambusicola thoracicus]
PRPTDPNLLHADADALQRLVALSHGHSRECGFVPDVKPPAPGSPAPLVWECVAGHRFSWGVPSAGDAPQRCDGAGGGSERGSPPVPVRRRSLRRTGVVVEPMVEEPNAVKDDAVWSPGGGGDGGGDGAPQGQMEAETAAPDHESTPGLEEKADGHAVPQEEEEEEDEDFAEEDDLTYTDDLRDENYHPSQDSDSEPQRRQSQPHTRKKPVKEEQTPNEQNPIDSSSAEEKGGQVRHEKKTQLIFAWSEPDGSVSDHAFVCHREERRVSAAHLHLHLLGRFPLCCGFQPSHLFAGAPTLLGREDIFPKSLPMEVNGKSIIAFLLSLSSVGRGTSHSTGIQFGGGKVRFRSRWSLLTAEVKRKGCKQPTRPCDEDVAQIGPKRIRKAAKREILLCDFEGCGKIFSNRQ